MSGPITASFGLEAESMETWPEDSLRRLMNAGPLRRDELRLVVEDLAKALSSLQDSDLIHHDLRPENILVRRREPLDLCLGPSSRDSPAGTTGHSNGKAFNARYDAPETLSDLPGRTAGWWSLGMILFELLTGRHPFEGLSDAVITHRLLTAGIDLSGVNDPDWRKLCRGLLLHDPQKRWGAAEVRRWLDGDANLLMPQDDLAGLGAHEVLPYRLEGTLCHTHEELAVGLTEHWDTGRKDLMAGLITSWARDELKDQNLVHFLQDLLGLRNIKEDLRLFRLIQFLAPTLPPVWRGKSLTVPGLCAQATRAVQGDFPTIDWVVSIFAQGALQELSPAQYPAEAALATRWEEQHAHCMQLWQETTLARTDLRNEQSSIQGVSDFDALVYGEPAGLSKPSPFKLLPMLLLALADASYGSDLRQKIRTRADDWLTHNPWLGHLLASDEPAAWVMANFLLPYARDEASSAQKRLQLEARQEATRYVELTERTNEVLAELRNACASLSIFAGTNTRSRAASASMNLLEIVAAARTQGVPQDNPLMRTLRRAEPIALRIQKRLDTWSQATPLIALWSGVGLGKAIRQLGQSLPARVPL